MASVRPITRIEDLECYLVGGAVRDKLLGIERTDQDWVVVGANPEIMLSLDFKAIGKDFPVYLHPETHEEYALARTERKTGKGYKGFVVDVSEGITLEQDLYRRDLTINAMALATDGNLVDPFGGKQDLENGLLRHVSDHFAEDPLRVLRVARFAARFYSRGFVVEDSTLNLMKQLSNSGELDDLAAERIWQEFQNAIRESNPAVFFTTLRCCDALRKLFPEIDRLFDGKGNECKSSAMEQLDRTVELTSNVEYRFSVIAYAISRHTVSMAHELSTANDLNTLVDGSIEVRRLCRRLKTPASFRDQSIRIARFAENIRLLNRMSPTEVVDMIRVLNGVRNPEQFKNFLQACWVLLKVACEDSNYADKAVDLLQQCRGSMVKVDAHKMSTKYSGKKLGKKVRKAQISLVAEAKNNI